MEMSGSDNIVMTPERLPLIFRTILRVQHIFLRFFKPLTLGVRAVVIDGNGHVFLVRHSYTPGWHLPGGGVEPGETACQALVRELAEEGNIALSGAPELIGIYLNRYVSRRDHVLVYVVRHFRQSGPPDPNWEIREAGFFPRDALPDGVTRGTRARLEQVFDGAPGAPLW